MKKNILITGSTDGVGKGTALKLAKEGHTIWIHGRSAAKVEESIKTLKEATTNEDIYGLVADFSDLSAVAKMAENLMTKIDSLDILINNAGVFKSETSTTKDGLDLRMTVNFLAPLLLTNTLLDCLKKSSAPRVVNLSSAAQSEVSFSVLKGIEQVSENISYAQSKLALTMWSFDLAKKEPWLVVLAVNPGSLLDTKMAKEAYGQHWSPATKGVDIVCDLALDEAYSPESGHYFDNDKGALRGYFSKAHPDAYDQEKVAALMAETQALIEGA